MAGSADLLVFAWGNSSRGDDGAGPEIARRLRELDKPGVVIVEDMQLQIEHVADMQSDVPVLFVDASVAIPEGIAIERVWPDDDPSVTTHAVSPAALLRLFETTMRTPLPPAWQLHIAATSFQLGEQAGDVNIEATERAWRFLERLLEAPASGWADTLERSRSDQPTRASA